MSVNSRKSLFIHFLITVLLFPGLIISCKSEIPPTSTDTEPEDFPTEEPTEDLFTTKREAMVSETIENRGITDANVLKAMRAVPRHEFVPEDYRDFAYMDNALPIGYGQTISQPYIVAWMTELLDLKPGDRVLEIGTGSGYQAAILAEYGDIDVYSIEIVPELAERSAKVLEKFGYQVTLKNDDGYFGWEEYAPYDAIIVTAAPDHLPSPLVNQLKPDGRIVIPIGPPGSFQTLWMFQNINGDIQGQNLGLVTFVPLTGSGHEGGDGSQ